MFFVIPGMTAQAAPISGEGPGQQRCVMDRCGVAFDCEASWKRETIDQDAIMFMLSDDPFVSVTVSSVKKKITFLEELSRVFFADQDLYLDNFQISRVAFAGKEAVKLKAFSRLEPDMRFLGYYYLHRSNLCGVLFAIYPKDRWDDYKFLIQDIAESFKFLEE